MHSMGEGQDVLARVREDYPLGVRSIPAALTNIIYRNILWRSKPASP